jgi:hypothetical protein
LSPGSPKYGLTSFVNPYLINMNNLDGDSFRKIDNVQGWEYIVGLGKIGEI